MSLQDILQKILDEAKLEISQIQKELEKEKAVFTEEIEKEKTKELAELEEKKKKVIEKINQKIDLMARRETKQKMLAVRHELITKAMNSFAEYLNNLSDDKYGKILEKLFADFSNTDEGVILVPAKKMELIKKFAPKGFKVEIDDSVKGGFIAKLGKAEVDNTFSNLVFSEFYNEIRAFFAEKLGLI